jgi:hypothetical protein
MQACDFEFKCERCGAVMTERKAIGEQVVERAKAAMLNIIASNKPEYLIRTHECLRAGGGLGIARLIGISGTREMNEFELREIVHGGNEPDSP